jgi:hypothetical protein
MGESLEIEQEQQNGGELERGGWSAQPSFLFLTERVGHRENKS